MSWDRSHMLDNLVRCSRNGFAVVAGLDDKLRCSNNLVILSCPWARDGPLSVFTISFAVIGFMRSDQTLGLISFAWGILSL